jgi:hypothetical protein
MKRMTRDDVTRAVGRIDDVTVAEIIATGATVDELAEAQAWIANDEPLMNAGKPLATGASANSSISLRSLSRVRTTTRQQDPWSVRPEMNSPLPLRERGKGQLSFRFGIGASNCAISAVCRALPLKVSTLPSLEMAT